MRTIPVLVLLALPAGCDRAEQSVPGGSLRPVADSAPAAVGEAPARGVLGPARPRVLIQIGSPRYGLTAEHIAGIAREVPEVDVVAAQRDEMLSNVAEADALLGVATPELVRAGKRLRWIHAQSGGVEGYLFAEIVESDITLTNAKIIQGPEIADHALALLLSLTRGLNRIIARRASEEWTPTRYQPIELRGKTALIIGLGGIGVQIALRASACGMKVLGVDPEDVPYLDSVDRVVKPDQLPEVLPIADVIFVSAPLTSRTRGMMGPAEFAAMKPGAFLINVSRGEIIQTEALVQALGDGRLGGAGLDVTDPEPLPKGHALWKFENVVITPHIAGVSDGIPARRVELTKENLRRFARGLPLVNVVDKKKGY